VSPSLLGVAKLARSAKIEIPGLKRGNTVNDINGTFLAVASAEPNVSEPLWPVVPVGAWHSVDYLGLAVRHVLLRNNVKVTLGKIEYIT
jgi:hypothetical protein